MQQETDSFDAGSLYVLTTRFEFGEYDFDRNLFPLNALTESSYFSYSNRRTLNSYTLPSSFKFGFRNPGMIGDLSIDEAGVKAFVQSRKDRYVKVNRKVYAMIYFIGLELADSGTQFSANIEEVLIYSDKERQNLMVRF